MSRKQFYTIVQLGENQSKTPEGYLLCENVPIARTGEMAYHGSELMNGQGEYAVTPSDEGIVIIRRTPDEVFRPETIVSYNGKSVTDEHPEDGVVTPETWQERTVGVVLNPRRGVGEQEDLLLADMLITVPEAIEAVLAGKREVSCGYEADYEETGVGEGMQTNIIGNHVALVERGRCGWRCAIGDQNFLLTEEINMSKKKGWLDKLRQAFQTKDEGAFEEAIKAAPMGNDDDDNEGGEGGDTHIHVHAPGSAGEDARQRFTDDQIQEHMDQNAREHEEMRSRLEAIEKHVGMTSDDDEEIEGNLEVEAPIGTGDKARVATDSLYMQDSYTETVAAAEILAPGIQVPKFDLKRDPRQTFKDVCGLRRQALDMAYARSETRATINELLGGRTLDTNKMSCDSVRVMFRSAASMQKVRNNDAARGTGTAPSGKPVVKTSQIRSVSDINRLYDEQMLGKK